MQNHNILLIQFFNFLFREQQSGKRSSGKKIFGFSDFLTKYHSGNRTSLQGEYKLLYDKLYHCESTKNNPIQLNWFISKKTFNITELKGNPTSMIPFDDKYSYSKYIL